MSGCKTSRIGDTGAEGLIVRLVAAVAVSRFSG